MTTTLHFHRPADAGPVTVGSRPTPPAPSLLERLMARLFPRPVYRMAPPLRNAHFLGAGLAASDPHWTERKEQPWVARAITISALVLGGLIAWGMVA